MKRFFGLVLITIFLAGCSSEKTVDSSINDIEEPIVSTELETNDHSNMTDTDTDTSEILESTTVEQDRLANNSQVRILNFLQDGTFWAIETNETDERYIIHADVYGNVMDRLLSDEFNGTIRYGIDHSTIVEEEDDQYHIFDVNSKEEISNKYIGDYDEIDSIAETDEGLVFIIKKTIESFEEKYECFKLVDTTGNIMFEISLDSNTLLNEYGIVKSGDEHEVIWFANNMYYIRYVGSAYDYDENGKQVLNSLIIDLNRNKVTPVAFPQSNGFYCSSDGNYTVVYVPQHGKLKVNNETGEFEDFPNDDYDPAGEFSENKLFATGHWNGNANEKVVLDVQGNIVIDLNNYANSVSKMFPFTNDAALIEFSNDYVTFIDTNGEFLFEPIKGNVRQFYSKQCIAVIVNKDKNEVFSVDRNGNIEMLDLLGSDNIFFIEYEGNNYWVEGGQNGLHTVEVK